MLLVIFGVGINNGLTLSLGYQARKSAIDIDPRILWGQKYSHRKVV
jgi:hypothetical protein